MISWAMHVLKYRWASSKTLWPCWAIATVMPIFDLIFTSEKPCDLLKPIFFFRFRLLQLDILPFLVRIADLRLATYISLVHFRYKFVALQKNPHWNHLFSWLSAYQIKFRLIKSKTNRKNIKMIIILIESVGWCYNFYVKSSRHLSLHLFIWLLSVHFDFSTIINQFYTGRNGAIN